MILRIINARIMLMVSDVEARRKKLAKLEKKRKSKLSFAFDDEADDASEPGTPSAYDSSAKPSRSASVHENDDDSTTKRKRTKLGKDPTVNTSFLPDREREEQERIANEIKREEWLKRQEEIKAETVEIQFAYFDGLSHLGSVTVKKGEPIFNLIDKAKQSFSAIGILLRRNCCLQRTILLFLMNFRFIISPHMKSRGNLVRCLSFMTLMLLKSQGIKMMYDFFCVLC